MVEYDEQKAWESHCFHCHLHEDHSTHHPLLVRAKMVYLTQDGSVNVAPAYRDHIVEEIELLEYLVALPSRLALV